MSRSGVTLGSIEPQVSNGSPEFSSEVLEAVMLFM